MADVFDKPDGWAETFQLVSKSILLLPHEQQHSRVFAIDCEMVWHDFSITSPAQSDSV